MAYNLVSNKSAVAFLARCELKNPKLLARITQLWLPRKGALNVKNTYPKFFNRYFGYFDGNYTLARSTLIYKKVNLCPICGGLMRSAGQSGCSPSHAGLDPKVRNKWRDTYKKNTGYSHNSQNPDVQRKRKDNYKAKTGYAHWSSNPEVQAKKEQTNLARCGYKFPMQEPRAKVLSKESMLSKYGVSSNWGREEVRKAAIAASLKKYGVPYNAMRPAVQNKKVQTNLTRTGHPSGWCARVRKKSIETNVSRWGVPWTQMAPEIKDRVVQGKILKYGVRHHMQVPEIFARTVESGYLRKVWTSTKGTSHLVQGSEPLVLTFLESNGARNIRTGARSVPQIPYDKGRRKYYPDATFVAPTGKKFLLEVKSTWTLERDLARNLEKFKAANVFCRSRGVTFLLAIVNGRKEISLIGFPTKEKLDGEF